MKLLVEDDRNQPDAQKAIWKQKTMRVICAVDGEEACEKFEK